MAALHPGINPAGHALETQLVAHLRNHFVVRTTGVLPLPALSIPNADPASGVSHDLILLEKSPAWLHRFRSVQRLKGQYLLWRALGWEPEAVLVYNLSPIYNQFIRWLRRQPRCPKLVLLLLDSPRLGQRLSWLKHLRYRCKPFHVPDDAMLPHFDACVGLSPTVERYFRPGPVQFLWMPGGCTPERKPAGESRDRSGPLRLGYFGALGPHSGVSLLAQVLIEADLPATLEICGYGKMSEHFAGLAQQHPQLKFHGLRSPEACLRFGQGCDVLVNPRPLSHGNENNFPSKIFEYALTGRPILTTRLSGVDDVLGPEAFYFDPGRFGSGLEESLGEIVRVSRHELDERGAAIQHRVLSEFSWERQSSRLALFIQQVCSEPRATAEVPEALAA
jgi:glycosyltransferase involved in cell wall biosynthesis